MSKHMRWITLACLPACTIGQSATLYGEMSVAPTAQQPEAVDVVAVFSPERADHVSYPGGGYGWPAKYERLPLETSLGVEILPPPTAPPWDPPYNCP